MGEMSQSRLEGNMEFYEKENVVQISINPKVFSLEVVKMAAYTLIDRTYVVLSGDPDDEIIVELKPKDRVNLDEIARLFNNELINFSVFLEQSERNKGIKETILKRALMTNEQSIVPQKEKAESKHVLLEDEKDEDDIDFGSFEEDPENIMNLWNKKNEE